MVYYRQYVRFSLNFPMWEWKIIFSPSSYRKRSKKLKHLIFAQLQTLKNHNFSINFYFFRLDCEYSESLKVYRKGIDQIIPIPLFHRKWMKILKIDQSEALASGLSGLSLIGCLLVSFWPLLSILYLSELINWSTYIPK